MSSAWSATVSHVRRDRWGGSVRISQSRCPRIQETAINSRIRSPFLLLSATSVPNRCHPLRDRQQYYRKCRNVYKYLFICSCTLLMARNRPPTMFLCRLGGNTASPAGTTSTRIGDHQGHPRRRDRRGGGSSPRFAGSWDPEECGGYVCLCRVVVYQ